MDSEKKAQLPGLPSMQTLYDQAPVGYMSTDAEGRILRINKTLQRWLALDEETLLGKSWTAELLGRVGKVFVETHAEPLLALRGHANDLLLDLLNKDGTRLPMLVNIALDPDQFGILQFSFIKAVDRLHYETQLLGAKQQAEDMAEQLRELANDLEQLVEARTAELVAANEDLDSFAYTVSHDLRSPLRTVAGFCGLMVMEAGQNLSPALQDYIHQIQRAVKSMDAMINGLLQLSMGMRAQLERKSVDLSALATQICGEMRVSSPEKAVHCKIRPGMQVVGDPRLLEVVLRNLLGNAWKYSRPDSEARVELGVRRDDELGMVFFVADNGVGFPMAQAEQLFQPFKRLPDTIRIPGLGIGLATVRRIIERHGGRIRARAQPGQGAEFYFSIPDALENSLAQ